MNVSHVGYAIVTVALLSCAAPTDNELPAVELLTDRTTYVMGDSAVLTLTNHSRHSIIGDLGCGETIQRMEGTSWESVGNFPEVCLVQWVNPLGPGDSDVRGFEVVPPAFASAGQYRIQVPAWDPKRQQSFVVSSDPFTVEN
jgi:hypothetical protein